MEMAKRLGFILLVLENAHLVDGKTKMQKMLFLLNKEHNTSTGYDFQIYTYVPYSFQLTNDLVALKDVGLVNVSSSTFVNNSEFIGKQFKYSLTENGKRELANNLGIFTPEEISAVKEVVSKWNDKSLPEIIKYVYSKYMNSEVKNPVTPTFRINIIFFRI